MALLGILTPMHGVQLPDYPPNYGNVMTKLTEQDVKKICDSIDQEGELWGEVVGFRNEWDHTTKVFEMGTPSCSWTHAFIEVFKLQLR